MRARFAPSFLTALATPAGPLWAMPGPALRSKDGGNLRDLLTPMTLRAPFMDLPSKENGFDVMGFAVFRVHEVLARIGPPREDAFHAATWGELLRKAKDGIARGVLQRHDGWHRERSCPQPPHGCECPQYGAVGQFSCGWTASVSSSPGGAVSPSSRRSYSAMTCAPSSSKMLAISRLNSPMMVAARDP